MAEAKKEGAQGEEPSMEEILQSIKKIIAEDEPADKAAAPAAKPNGNGAQDEAKGSDVLELTEMVPEEKPVAEKKEEAPPAKEAAALAAASAPSKDVLNKIDEALATEKPTAAPAAATPPPSQEALLSDQAAQAANSAVKKLQTAAEPPLPEANTTPSPVFASGNSVEAMVMDMLRPMMKDWLDKNLPSIVERIVTIEIRKITK